MGILSTFYGTSSVHVTDGETGIFVDAFLSRPTVADLLRGRLEPDDEAIGWALGQGGVAKLDALFVSHSHHDHLMDSPRVVRRLGGVMYGSRSSLNYGRGEGLAESSMAEIAGGDVVRVGDFTVTVVEAPHSPGNIAPGVIREVIAPPCRTLDFKDGGCFVFHIAHPTGTVVVLPSANYRPGFLDGLRADVLYLGIGALGRQSERFRRDYWAHTVGSLRPHTVIPVHWDNFTRPLSKPLTSIPLPADRVGVSKSFLERKAGETGCQLRFPRAFESYELS